MFKIRTNPDFEQVGSSTATAPTDQNQDACQAISFSMQQKKLFMIQMDQSSVWFFEGLFLGHLDFGHSLYYATCAHLCSSILMCNCCHSESYLYKKYLLSNKGIAGSILFRLLFVLLFFIFRNFLNFFNSLLSFSLIDC